MEIAEIGSRRTMESHSNAKCPISLLVVKDSVVLLMV